jgi:hypothetical protein
MTGPLGPALLIRAASALVRSRHRGIWLAAPASAVIALVVLLGFGFALALGGADLGCLGGGSGGGGSAAGPPPSRQAVRDIPRARLRLYQLAGRAANIDWTFLASIGAQECNHGSCAGDNGYGCAGPMQISFRRGSACSPGSGPTEWDLHKTDGDGDGRADIDNPADAIFTAAKVLRKSKGAPPARGSYSAYRQAACNYYGACGDGVANYADEVMARAVQYGFRGAGSPPPTNPALARPAPGQAAPSGGGGACGGGVPVGGAMGPVKRLRAPRHLAPLSASVSSGRQLCDARIVANVEYLARRFRQQVTACFGIHSLNGDHPLGAAIDTVPADGNWQQTERLARSLGWRPGCASSGLAPTCARPPFRAIFYNGFPGHGDPSHCACKDNAHLHVSWNTSASLGQPENAARTSYFAPSWIDVFTVGSR